MTILNENAAMNVSGKGVKAFTVSNRLSTIEENQDRSSVIPPPQPTSPTIQEKQTICYLFILPHSGADYQRHGIFKPKILIKLNLSHPNHFDPLYPL